MNLYFQLSTQPEKRYLNFQEINTNIQGLTIFPMGC